MLNTRENITRKGMRRGHQINRVIQMTGKGRAATSNEREMTRTILGHLYAVHAKLANKQPLSQYSFSLIENGKGDLLGDWPVTFSLKKNVYIKRAGFICQPNVNRV